MNNFVVFSVYFAPALHVILKNLICVRSSKSYCKRTFYFQKNFIFEPLSLIHTSRDKLDPHNFQWDFVSNSRFLMSNTIATVL